MAPRREALVLARLGARAVCAQCRSGGLAFAFTSFSRPHGILRRCRRSRRACPTGWSHPQAGPAASRRRLPAGVCSADKSTRLFTHHQPVRPSPASPIRLPLLHRVFLFIVPCHHALRPSALLARPSARQRSPLSNAAFSPPPWPGTIVNWSGRYFDAPADCRRHGAAEAAERPCVAPSGWRRPRPVPPLRQHEAAFVHHDFIALRLTAYAISDPKDLVRIFQQVLLAWKIVMYRPASP
jgi:hypothetical protein